MNTTLKVTLAAVVAVAVFGAGFAFAQSMSPWGGGYGMMNGQGRTDMMTGQTGTVMMNSQRMTGGMGTMLGVDMNTMRQWMATSSSMHDRVWGGVAEALSLSPADLSAQLAGGQTLAALAEAQGLTQEELAAALEISVKAGLDQAVADGVVTPAQADQMLNHMAGRYVWMLTQTPAPAPGAGVSAGLGVGPGNCHNNAADQSNS